MLVILSVMLIVGICIATDRRQCAATSDLGSCGTSTDATTDNGCVQVTYTPSGLEGSGCTTQDDSGGDSCSTDITLVFNNTITWTVYSWGCGAPMVSYVSGSSYNCEQATLAGSCD